MDRIAVRTTRESCILEEPLIYYRRHGGNVTELTHGSITSMIKKKISYDHGNQSPCKKNGADMTNKIKDILKTHKYLLLSFFLPVLLLEGIAIAEKIQPFGSESFLIVDALHQYLPFLQIIRKN